MLPDEKDGRKWLKNEHELWRTLLSGDRCRSCGRPSGGGFLCEECYKVVSGAKYKRCDDCGCQMYDCICYPPKLSDYGIDRVIKIMNYRPDRAGDPKSKFVYYMKRVPDPRPIKYSAHYLAPRIFEEILPYLEEGEVPIITYAPRSLKNISHYGFDHGKLIAREVARVLEGEFVCCFKRRPWGGVQKRMSGARRTRNASHSIALCKGAESLVRDRVVVIVDDVITSGSTFASCLEQIYELPIRKVFCACVARSVQKHEPAKMKDYR